MAAANVTNNTTVALTVGGVSIGPGRTAAVERWDVFQDVEPVRTYLTLGSLSVDDEETAPAARPEKGRRRD